MKQLSLLVIVIGLTLNAFTQSVFAQSDKILNNLDKDGVAIQGYDPVAFFTDHKPVKGTAGLQSTYHGGIYWFASAEHKALFDANPGKFEPAFGGYCAYGVAKKHLSPIKVDAFQIVDGHLLMQHNQNVRDAFNQDQKVNLATAYKNWPTLVEKRGNN